MGARGDEQNRAERAREVALFRYALVREAADPTLSTRARGRLVRELAAAEHAGPFGTRVRVSRATLDRWIRTWRAGGFDALLPPARQVDPRTPAEVLELAAALKREAPGRTAAQVRAILAAHAGAAPSERTLQRHFAAAGLNVRPDGSTPASFGRFEAERVGERWVGDALHGPVVAGRKAILFAFLDDYSRFAVGYRFTHLEDTIRLQGALRLALAVHGAPASIYVDNGGPYVDQQLAKAAATLGIRLVHATPNRPQGKGKIERWFATVRGQFLVEYTAAGRPPIADLGELNEAFTAWVSTVYHRRVHSETGASPLARFSAAEPPRPVDPEVLRQAFLWSAWRTVTKVATISLYGNGYEVDPALAGRRVEAVFDPFDLTRVEIRYHGRSMGVAVPARIHHHAHPKARPEHAPPPAPTGIDYLKLVTDRHAAELAGRLRYAGLDEQEKQP
ncbi:MAG: DDE-type integrase/transposase/recombinase [Mycobacteriales bacterium]